MHAILYSKLLKASEQAQNYPLKGEWARVNMADEFEDELKVRYPAKSETTERLREQWFSLV